MNVNNALKINAETPFMAIDEDQTKINIKNMQKIANSSNKRLRPHSKTHKIPEIASWQISEGASGVCVQKVSEAEVMFNGGITNILISNEVVDKRKTDRIAKLASEGCNISVAVDSLYGAKKLSESALYKNVKIDVLLDIDTGMHRCGVSPSNIEGFNNSLKNLNGLNVSGWMAYDGQVHNPINIEREKEVEIESVKLKLLSDSMKNKINQNIISVGGTPTAYLWAKYDFVNELQPGTYVYYDMHCNAMNLCSISDISMGVVSQVMSKSSDPEERVVLDAGYKSISLDQGVYPTIITENGQTGNVTGMSEEHTVVDSKNLDLKIGDRVVMLPYHACTTTDFWDYAWLFSKFHNSRTLLVQGRGKRE